MKKTLEERAKEPFADKTSLVNATLWCLIALGASNALGVVTSSLELAILSGAVPDSLPSLIVVLSGIFGLVYVVLYFASIYLSLRFIYFANLNARRLGADTLNYTPGWAIGWYFVPIMNLFRPYEAVKEIWLAAEDPLRWRNLTPPRLLPTWWTLWLINTVLAGIIFRAARGADEVNEFVVLSVLQLLSYGVGVALTVAYYLVSGIHRRQMQLASVQSFS